MTEIVLPSGFAPPSDAQPELRTFLFADIRGYTRFTQEQGTEAAVRLVTKFSRLTHESVRSRGGRVIEVAGDEAVAVFGSARQALRAAVDLQATFARETESEPDLPLPVGVGLDAGEVLPLGSGYRGDALNLASRLCNLAGPGEILASEGVVYLGRRVQGVSYAERGTVPLKGFVEPVRVIRVIGEEAAQVDRRVRSVPPAPRRHEAALPIGGFLGALPSGVLVGREIEWERIMVALDEVSKGTGRLVLVSGEPGIGKTRLAQEVTLKARHWGFLVATGRCYEQEQAVPYFPFLEALTTVYNECPPALQLQVPHRWPYLARLLPDQLGFVEGAPSRDSSLDGEDQQRLFRAVTQLLEAISETTPVALLLDDLHWADDSSLKLLQHLTRYTRTDRVLLLGMYRDVEVRRQHPLEGVLLDLGREGLLQEVELRRLDLEGTARLMAEILGEDEELDDLVELVHRRTDGNAFFIGEMLRALVERGDVYRRDGRWERRGIREMEVPKSIRSLIGQRLSRLELGAQEILRRASVLGQEFAFDDLDALNRLADEQRHLDIAPSEDDIDGALEQAMIAGLVRETKPERYAFNHALTQQALYSELTTRRRKRLHLAAGKALERLSERARKRRAGELEWHFLEADDAERALGYAFLAGDGAEEVFANGDAERHYRTALELARDVGNTTREVEALEKLASVLTTVAKFDKALDLLEEAVQMHRTAANLEGEACVVAQIGHVHFVAGWRKEGIDRLKALVDRLEYEPALTKPSPGLAALWTALARLYMDRTCAHLQLKAARRAVELATEISDERLRSNAEVSMGVALWALGQEEEALRVLEGVIPRAEHAGDLHTLARALGNLGELYAARGDLDKDRQYHERMLAVSERRGDRGQIVLGSMSLSMYAFIRGDWETAEMYIQRAEAIIQGLGSSPLATWPTSARGWMALRRGDLSAALRLAGDALALTQQAEPHWKRHVLRQFAEIELLEGNPRAALEHLAPGLDLPGWQEDPAFLGTLAWTYLENEDIEAAERTALDAVQQTRASKDRTDLPTALIVGGMVAAAQRRWEEAQRHLDEALALARSMTMPFEEGRALLECGRLDLSRGLREDASSHVAAAAELFRGLGATRDLERAEALTRRAVVTSS